MSGHKYSSLGALTKDKDALERVALNELNDIGFTEILDGDARPTFVLDLDSDYLDFGDTKSDIRPIFCNAALRLHDRLLDNVTGGDRDDAGRRSNNATYVEFRTWATGVSQFDDSRDVFPLTLLYGDLLWVGSTIRKRWRIISGNQCYDIAHLPKNGLHEGPPKTLSSRSSRRKSPPKPDQLASAETTAVSSAGTAAASIAPTAPSGTLVSTVPPQLSEKRSPPNTNKTSVDTSSTNKSGASIPISYSPEHGVVDWTATIPRGTLTEHMKFARNIDWATTPLGPMKNWSARFREVANLVMQNPHPCSIFWGEGGQPRGTSTATETFADRTPSFRTHYDVQ